LKGQRGSVRCERCGSPGASHFADSSVLCTTCAGLHAAQEYVQDRGPMTLDGLPRRSAFALYAHAACSLAVVGIASRFIEGDVRHALWLGAAIFGGIVPAAVAAPWRSGPAVVLVFHVALPLVIFGLIGRLPG
jgi:hypothetical protein